MYITPNDNPLPAFRSSGMTRACLVICLLGIVLLGICSSVFNTLSNVASL